MVEGWEIKYISWKKRFRLDLRKKKKNLLYHGNFSQEAEDPIQRDCSVSILGYLWELTGSCQALKESCLTWQQTMLWERVCAGGQLICFPTQIQPMIVQGLAARGAKGHLDQSILWKVGKRHVANIKICSFLMTQKHSARGKQWLPDRR